MDKRSLVPTLLSLADTLADSHARAKGLATAPELAAFLTRGAIPYGGEFARLKDATESQIRTANRKLTIAVIGEFKAGKSTLLNGLLGLSGEAALSAKDAADTACSIILRGAEPDGPEARLTFVDGDPEEVTWARAKQLTSQVYLNEHPAEKATADRLVEVEYFVAHPLLSFVNFNDLPGIGSRYVELHTELAHKKMKEADAVLWVVGEGEPTQDTRTQLELLASFKQGVVPIQNIIENPELGIERCDDEVEAIHDAMVREYQHFFDIPHVIQVSAKVVELERQKASPDPEVLERAGYNALMDLLQKRFTGETDKSRMRLHRLCASVKALADEAQGSLAVLVEEIERQDGRLKAEQESRTTDLQEITDVHQEVRGRVRSIARTHAGDLSRLITGKAESFIADTLQLSNLQDLKDAVISRRELEATLKRRFMERYLQLPETNMRNEGGPMPPLPEDNWLQQATVAYAEDVRAIVLPAWRRLTKKLEDQFEMGSIKGEHPLDFAALTEKMFQAIVATGGMALLVGGVMTVLLFIPGGQIIDAIGILLMAALSVVHDPLEGHRKRAIQRMRNEISAQRYALENDLLKVAMKANDQIQKAVEAVLKGRASEADVARRTLQGARDAFRAASDDLERLVDGLKDIVEEEAAHA